MGSFSQYVRICLWTLTTTIILSAVTVTGSRQNFTHDIVYIPFCTFDNDIIDDDQKFDSRLRESDNVFTGKVNSNIRPDVSGVSKSVYFNVTVKRNIKGEAGNRVKLKLTLRDGEGTKCKLVVRHRYTAIFLARKSLLDSAADLELTLRPVPFSLRNLDRVNTAVKGKLSAAMSCTSLLHHSFTNPNYQGRHIGFFNRLRYTAKHLIHHAIINHNIRVIMVY